MTQEKYFKLLIKLAKLDDIIVENTDFPEKLFGYFQCFMPDGKGIEKIFEPIPNGTVYLDRLKKIYEITQAETVKKYDERLEPIYFIPQKTKIEQVELITIGNKLIEKFKLFAIHISDDELLGMLKNIRNVKIVNDNIRKIESDNHMLVEDTISDWVIDNSNHDDLIEILKEAYYSIACDYWLSYYFQYPRYSDTLKIDFLEPYFNIWANGYYCKFSESELLISSVT